jgi:quinoprotein glucose dehydrogenase
MLKSSLRVSAVAAGFAGVVVLSGLAAAAPGDDWPTYGHDAGGMRYSPLTQITPQNVSTLKVAWTYHMKPTPQTRALPSQMTPLVVGNTMYFGTPYGRVVALDATTGKEIWIYQLPEGERPSVRGIAYWPGEGSKYPAALVFGTTQGNLRVIDAKTGKPSETFGDHGVITLRTPEIMRGYTDNYAMSSAPGIYKNIVITNASNPEKPKGPSGDTRGWDLRTGKLVWTFHSIPRPGEFGHDTWPENGWQDRPGVNVWSMMTVDAKRGIAYLPYGEPGPDRWGGDRHGANLFANSIVALNATTGKYLWHFQMLHHAIWDHDNDTPPMLLDVKKDGKVIPAVAAMNKTAILFLLDRVTGKPIYEVKEVPAPASTVPGEKSWPTQPLPVKPPPLARQSFTAATDVATVTPEHKAFCENLIKTHKLHDSVMFSPLTSDSQIARFPGSGGGPEWGGGTFDAKRGYYIVNTHDMGSIEQLELKPGGFWGSTTGPDSFFIDEDKKLMCQQPPWGSLYAVNVNTGDIAWRVTLGVTDSLPEAVRNTGRPSIGGPISTASGLTFLAATDDSRFRAFDNATGKELWTYKMEYSAHTTPITYKGTDGKQYVAIIATGGSFLRSPMGGDSLTVFSLP